MSTHLYLVSSQPTPNITPALDQRTAPGRIILLVSEDMRERAEWLENVYKPRGIKVERWPIKDAFDIEHLQIRLLELIEAEKSLVEDNALSLNATGGTKPMSIAAYDVFRTYNLPIFYIHPEKDRLIWLYPDNDPVDLENRVRMEAFFVAHGASVGSIIRSPIPGHLRQLTKTLVANLNRYRKTLGQLNWLAARARNNLTTPVSNDLRKNPSLNELINLFSEADLLTMENRHLHFTNEAARFYTNGGWFEEYVFSTIQEIRSGIPGIQDVARSIEVTRSRGKQRIPNEIDVAVLANNRLYIIECKTRKWDEHASGADALYRLDTLKDLLGGLQARAMLASYQPLKKHDDRRARDLRIKTCSGDGITTLKLTLQQWIDH